MRHFQEIIPVAEIAPTHEGMLAPAQDWVCAFAKDVWQHPKDHPLAIAGTALALGAAVVIGKGAALKMCEEAVSSEGGLSHIPTLGARVRPWVEADLAACDKIAGATKMGSFIPGGQAWVLEAPKKGIVGYTSMSTNCWADIAVLPEYRGNTRLLANTALDAMRANGGKYFTNAKELTGYPFMKRLEADGAIKILRESVGFGSNPYHTIDFVVR